MIKEKRLTIVAKASLCLLAIGFLVLFSACGGGGSTGSTNTSATATTAPTDTPTPVPTDTPTPTPTTASTGGGGNSIAIANFAFSPATLTIKVGTKVTWTNNDSATHTVSEDNGAFDSGALPPGQSYSFTFTKAGTYTYHCKIHPSMTATITVQ